MPENKEIISEGVEQKESINFTPSSESAEQVKDTLEFVGDIKDTSETVKLGKSRFTAFPDRGGIITSVNIDGTELLYQDMYKETLLNSSKSVKGGIPYMFPNAGPLTPEQKENSGFDLPQHGTGRVSKWNKLETLEDGVHIQEYIMEKNENFPYEAQVVSTTELLEDGVVLTHKIENTGDEDMPVSTGLHPYFRVPEGNKTEIEWTVASGAEIKADLWANDGTLSFENPGEPVEVKIPGLGTLVIEVSDDYKHFWVWSLPGKDFVCVEPVMRNEGGIVEDPVIVKSGEKNSNFMKITLRK